MNSKLAYGREYHKKWFARVRYIFEQSGRERSMDPVSVLIESGKVGE